MLVRSDSSSLRIKMPQTFKIFTILASMQLEATNTTYTTQLNSPNTRNKIVLKQLKVTYFKSFTTFIHIKMPPTFQIFTVQASMKLEATYTT